MDFTHQAVFLFTAAPIFQENSSARIGKWGEQGWKSTRPRAEAVPHQLISSMNMYDTIPPSFFQHCKSATTSFSFHAVGRLKPSISMLSFVDFNVLHPGKKILLEIMGRTRCCGRKLSVVINPCAAPQDNPEGPRLFSDLFRRVNVNHLLPFLQWELACSDPGTTSWFGWSS